MTRASSGRPTAWQRHLPTIPASEREVPTLMDAQEGDAGGHGNPGRRTWNVLSRRMDSGHDITGLLLAWRAGDGEAPDRLFPLVYDELRRIAHRQLRHERPDHTLGTTGLVHEAYLKLVDQTRAVLMDRAHFYAVAARVMRRVLVDYARRYRALKRGGALPRVSLRDSLGGAEERAETLEALDDALSQLAQIDQRAAQVVECRFFGGLTEEETAEALGVTARTVRRDWVKAKGWLVQALRG